MLIELTTQRQSDTQGPFDLGTSGKQGNVLLGVQCQQPTAHPYLRREDAEVGLGKSEFVFCREYHDSEIAAEARAQQYPTKGHVGYRLHHESKGDLRRIRVYQCHGG
mgnify:CR=1 FL=1